MDIATTSRSQTVLATTPQTLPEQAEYLRQKFEKGLIKIRQNRNMNRKRAVFVKFLGISFTGLATLLLGLQLTSIASIQTEAAFALTSLATLLSAIEPFFNYRALWVEHEIAQWKLHRLQDELDYYLAKTKPESIEFERLDEYHNQYLEIWDNLSITWIDNRKRGGS